MNPLRLLLRAAATFALLAAGCNADPVASAEDLATAAPDQSVTPPDLAPVHSGIGDPCTGSGGMDQGSCADGQFCIPDGSGFGYTDGYCTANCLNTDCPDDAECIRFGGQFAFCQKKCGSEADCRAPDYTCASFGGGTPNVCRPTNPGGGGNGGGVPVGTRDGGACVTPILTAGMVDGGVWGKNIQVSGAGQSLEAEVQLAVAPGNANVVVSYNKLTAPAGIGVVKSSDDGLSWGKEAVLPLDTMVDKNNSQSDPVVAVDTKGNFFISWVGYNLSNQSPNPTNMNIYVARSSNGGATLDLISMAAPPNDAGNGGQLDKPWIYASPLDDSLWVTWCRFNANGTSDIRMVRSTDQGVTWSKPVSINDAGKRVSSERNLAQVFLGADGKATVAWVEIGNVQFGSMMNAVYLQRFNSDGTPSGANVKVTRAPDSPAFEDPSVAVAGNNVYVGFISGDPSGVWDVRVAASIDGGATFLPSVKANDDASCATHFHHQIAVDGKGNVHAIWYDNRYLTGNLFWTMAGPADAMNPLLFGRNQFVNDRPLTFTTRRDMSNWLGDYLGLWIAGGEMYAAWSDNRTNNRSHIFFAKAKIPQ